MPQLPCLEKLRRKITINVSLMLVQSIVLLMSQQMNASHSHLAPLTERLENIFLLSHMVRTGRAKPESMIKGIIKDYQMGLQLGVSFKGDVERIGTSEEGNERSSKKKRSSYFCTRNKSKQ